MAEKKKRAMTSTERSRKARRKDGVKERTAPVCGEMSGVWAHRNAREPLCEACRPVWAKYQKANYDPDARARRYRAKKGQS